MESDDLSFWSVFFRVLALVCYFVVASAVFMHVWNLCVAGRFFDLPFLSRVDAFMFVLLIKVLRW